MPATRDRRTGRPMGRPSVGPVRTVRLGVDLDERLAVFAKREGVSEAEAIRRLLNGALRREGVR